MAQKRFTRVILLSAFALGLTGCGRLAPSNPTSHDTRVMTAGAQSATGSLTASPAWIPPGFTKQGEESGTFSAQDQQTYDDQRYVDTSVPAVIEVEVIQGFSSQEITDNINKHLELNPDGRQITVQGHAAWLLPPGTYSGLSEVIWPDGNAIVSVIGRGVDNDTVIKVADQLEVTP